MRGRHLVVRTRNTSCAPLREIPVESPVILRLGSTTPTNEITTRRNVKEINTANACKISGDKILMKSRFTRGHIPTAEWIKGTDNQQKVAHLLEKWGKIIIKHRHSSKGNGIYLIETIEDFTNFLTNKEYNVSSYVFEKYYSYSREYRLHITKDGCFYTCRKMLKSDATDRWHRHSTNSIWVVEENELFNKPTNWDTIVTACIHALKSIGLDIAAFDVKVQNSSHDNPKFIILESNSAPSLGELGLEKYRQQLTLMINNG